MTLSAGTRLGPYEIVSPLGAGGMGEVYRARDTRLGRDVAVKVLPEELAGDPERLRRFEGEARAASALSDPHIVTVFDVGADRGVHWFAAELVEGPDLRALIASDGLPVRKVLELAEQIASGLAAAHEKGIVHRDLKPENILLTRSGLAKIADFGLAKLAEQSGAHLSSFPTTDGHPTAAGVLMGTINYMSPEQARGAAIDFRSDQFAFGAIVHEMLTGRTVFRRGSPAETLAAILREEPPPLPAPVPAPLRWIVERCLSKEPDGRYGSTADLRRDLATIREHLSEAAFSAAPLSANARPGPDRPRPVSPGLLAAGVAVLAAGIVVGKFGWKGARPNPPTYHQITFESGDVDAARFAPDGQTILYSARWKGGPSRIYSTRTDSTESSALALPDASLFSISSTGKIAIGIRGTLAEAALAGGAPRDILEDVTAADWSPDGKDLAVTHFLRDRSVLEYPVGKVLVDPGAGGAVENVRFSPDGRRLAFIHKAAAVGGMGHLDVSSIGIYDLAREKATLLTSGWEAMGLAWTPDGKEIWFGARPAGSTSGGLVTNAVDLSGRTRVVACAPWVLWIQDIFRDGRVLLMHGYWPTTTLYRAPGASVDKDLSWLEFSFAQDLSTDGKTLLFGEGGISGGARGEVFLWKTDASSPPVRLGEGHPAGLSPDGKQAIAISAGPNRGLVVLPTGAGPSADLTTPGMKYLDAEWFPDGKRVLILGERSGDHSTRLFEQPVSGGAPRALPVTAAEIGPISPDGSTVAIPSESGEVRLLPIDGAAPKTIPGVTAREVLRWSGDGSAIFVRSGWVPAKLLRVDVRTGATTPIGELAPFDRSGVTFIGERPPITPDGSSYAYSFVRFLDDLYVVTGLR